MTRRTVHFLALWLIIAGAARAETVETSWKGASSPSRRSWHDPSIWTNGVPDNTDNIHYDVRIAAGDITASLANSSAVTIDNLTVIGGLFRLSTGEPLRLLGDLRVGSAGKAGILVDDDPPLPITSEIKGSLLNGGITEIGENMNIGGGISNTGRLVIGGVYPQMEGYQVIAQGPLAQQVNGVLTAGSIDVQVGTFYPTHGAINGNTLSWAGADIHVIPENVSVSIPLLNSIRDFTTGESALRNLRQVDGSFTVHGTSPSPVFPHGLTIGGTGCAEINQGIYQVDGDLSVFGRLFLNTTTETGTFQWGEQTSLRVSGSLTQQVGTTLTAGTYYLEGVANYRGLQSHYLDVTVAWTGADIEIIGENAGVTLIGARAALRDRDTQLDAFRNLKQVNGELVLHGRALDFTNGLTIGRNGRVRTAFHSLTSGEYHPQSWIVTGDLHNLGELLAGGRVTVTGDFSNPGRLVTSGSLTIAGALSQQVDGVLTAGVYQSNASSLLSWAGADIRTIGAGAEIILMGATSAMKDGTTGADALAKLGRVNGSFSIATRNFTTESDFLIDAEGKLQLGTAADFRVATGGTLDIQGELSLTTDKSLVTSLSVMDGDAVFGDAALFVLHLRGNVGKLAVNGTAFLNGALVLMVDELPDYKIVLANADIEILRADLVVDEFSNAPDGSRVALTRSGEVVGSMRIAYSDQQVRLSDFQAVFVPTPSPSPTVAPTPISTPTPMTTPTAPPGRQGPVIRDQILARTIRVEIRPISGARIISGRAKGVKGKLIGSVRGKGYPRRHFPVRNGRLRVRILANWPGNRVVINIARKGASDEEGRKRFYMVNLKTGKVLRVIRR